MRAVVVGAGVFGVTAAIELRRRGWEVVVVDPGPVPHPDAASTDITKAVRPDYGADAFYAEQMLAARPTWLEWNLAFEEPVYIECGMLFLAREPLAPGGYGRCYVAATPAPPRAGGRPAPPPRAGPPRPPPKTPAAHRPRKQEKGPSPEGPFQMYRTGCRTTSVHHADGVFGAGVDAGFAVDALVGVHPGVAVDHGDDLGRAGVDALFTGGALGLVNLSGHVGILLRTIAGAAGRRRGFVNYSR